MSVQYAPKGLIGLLTPQANTTAEIEFAALMPRGIEPLVARMTSARPTLESRLIEYFEGLDDTIVQFANAPIGAIAAACTGSSYLIGPEREDQLLNGLSTRFGRPVTSAGRSVVPVLTHRSVDAVRLSAALLAEGINVQPIFYPAVPENSARLRFFLSSEHTADQVRRAVEATASAALTLGIASL